MSSSTTDPPAPPDLTAAYNSFLHNVSLTMLVLSPILIALPPRKLDLYTFGLITAGLASANHLTVERTGSSILSKLTPSNLPEKARLIQQQQEARRKGRLLEEPISSVPSAGRPRGLEAKAREIWMGSETEGWKERRLKEEQEKIAQGEGYGSMIMDQIWEVWNWGEKKGEELKKTDERVLKDREREKEFPRIEK